ncbi:MAG: signal peptidase I [Bacteroidales bacterium]|nr:signal peptidase I [Bacteroidales bacterium]
MGRIEPTQEGVNPYWYQYEAFQNLYSFESYEAYYSQSAFQSFVYGLICFATGLSGDPALDYFKWLVSVFTAFMFTLFVMWVQCRWGWVTALFVLITICFSQWVTAFGRNLFWVLGAFYLPFVCALWYLQKYKSAGKHPLRVTFWLMFVTMLLKCLLTGFEYITTAMIMAVTPWVFYAVADRWGWRQFLRQAVVASCGTLTAVMSAIALLTLQLSVVMGSLGEGFRYIVWSFGKRSYGGGGAFDPVFIESQNSSQWDVLAAYWNGFALDISHWFGSPLWKMLSSISFGYCIVLFAGVSLVVFLSKTIRQNSAFFRQQLALTAMLWVSLLAPLSWFIIFKGHSYLHTHMNHIVWHMPFMLLGATLTGSTLWFLMKNSFQVSKARQVDKTSSVERVPAKKIVLWCLIGLATVVLLRLLVFEPVRVSGKSMEHTLTIGDWVVVNKLRYGARFPRSIADIPIVNVLTWNEDIREADRNRSWPYRRVPGYADIRRNDIVVFIRPGEGQLVKRVVGLPGEQLEIRAGKIRINSGQKDDVPGVVPGIRNDTLLQPEGWTWNDYGPVLIPEAQDGHREYFVMGDNRDNSIDSRHFGLISEEQIIGRLSFILFLSGQKTNIKRYIFQTIR